MPHIISRLCIRGGECAAVCPVECIVPGPASSAEWPYLYIDPESCIDCGACVAECPVNAIFPDAEVPAAYAEDIKLNREFFEQGPGYWDYDLDALREEHRNQ